MGTEGRVEIELNEVQKLIRVYVHNMPFPKYQLFAFYSLHKTGS